MQHNNDDCSSLLAIADHFFNSLSTERKEHIIVSAASIMKSRRRKREDEVSEVSKRRKLNTEILDLSICELSDDELEGAVETLCKTAGGIGKTVNYYKKLLNLWQSPFLRLPEKLVLYILSRSFSTKQQAFTLALVCKSWRRLFRSLDFWKPWLQHMGSSDIGLHYLFDNHGIEAAICCKTRAHQSNGWSHKTKSNGFLYMGKFVDGRLSGKAVIAYRNLSVYEGEVVKNLYHGRGTLYCGSGYLKGNFKKGSVHGHASLCTKKSGTYYIGNWENGFKCGYGKMVHPNDHEYRGQWLRNEKHGFGRAYYQSGDMYEGEWKNGKYHGHGIYYCMSPKYGRFNQVCSGNYKEGLLHGNFIHVWSVLGVVVKGSAVDDKWHGMCKFYFQNGDMACSRYDNGRPEGFRHFHLQNGNYFYYTLPQRKRTGRLLIRYANGDRYVAIVRCSGKEARALGTFMKNSLNRTIVDPFEGDSSGAQCFFKHFKFKLAT